MAVIAAEGGNPTAAWTVRRLRREIKRLKPFLGRVARDFGRALVARSGLVPHFERPVALIERWYRQ